MAEPTEEDADDALRWPYTFLPEKIGEGLFGPILPIYAATFVGASAMTIGAMEAVFQAMTVAGAFAWGRTSDEVAKRKAFILLGFLGAAASLFGMAFAESFEVLFAWRAIYGFMIVGFGAVGGALIADQSTSATIGDRMGLLRAVGGFGYVAGLVGGALLVLVRPTFELFALAGIFSLVSAVAAFLWIEEPASHLERHEMMRLLRNTTAPAMGIQRRLFNPTIYLSRPKLEGVQRRAWAYLGAIALSFVGGTAGFVLFPLYLDRIGLSSSTIFGLFILSSLLSAVLFRPMGNLADRVGYRKTQIAGFGVRGAMFLVLLLPFAGVPTAAVFLALAGISWAIISVTGPAALFRSMQIREKGELIGLYTIAAGFGSFLGALLGGVLADVIGFDGLFAAAAVLISLATAIVAYVVYPPHETG